jgi:mannosyltransferase OCH1-like enzyme
MIPKKIHYVWVNGINNIPEIEKDWIEKCKILNPEYKVKIWTEDDIPKTVFSQTMLDNKVYWAVSDYIRCYALYTEGGFYLDTDMEIIQPFPKEWLDYETILPREDKWNLSNFIMGSVKKGRLFGEILSKYKLLNDINTENTNEYVPSKFWNDTIVNTYGRWSITNPSNGEWIGSHRLKVLLEEECCPYYPWDKNRVGEFVDISNAIGVHYWNNYKTINGLDFLSLETKFFDE